MKILALDLSSNITGWCVIENGILITFGQIQLSKYKKKKFPLEYIKILYKEIEEIIKIHNPDKCAIEDTFARNVLTIKSLCRIRGIAEAALINNGVYDITLINAVSARKTAFGNGAIKSEGCFEKLKILYPDNYEKFYSKGYDMVDAIVLGIAATKKASV